MERGTKRVIPDSQYVIEDGLLLVRNCEPLDEFSGTRARPCSDIAKAIGREFCRFQLLLSNPRITSLVKNSMPQSV